MKIFERTTLHVRWPAGKTIAWSIPVLLLIIFLFEGTLRLHSIHDRLAPPKMASPHYQLGDKFRLLESFVSNNGTLDCVALGSSITDTGFDSAVFTEAFRRTTGQELNCFNFGIDALSAAGAGALAEILVHDYQPEILIFGTDPRDFAVNRHDIDTAVVLDTPWVQYRQDNFSLEGWAQENVYLWRYSGQLQQLLQFDYERALKRPRDDLTLWGQTPLYEVSENVSLPAKPNDDPYLSGLLTQFEFQSENLMGLRQMLDQHSSEMQVFIVVMPVADGYYSFFDNGRGEYNAIIDQLQDIVTDNGAFFLRPEPGIIPEDGWRDYVHLNVTGAKAFSDWLGAEIGKTIADNH